MEVQYFGTCNHCLGDLRNEKGFRKITRKSLSEWIHEDCLEKQQAGESPKWPKRADDMASYDGGAKRSKKLPRYELIDPTFLHEVAEVMAEGAVKYGELNWQKGGQDFVQDIPRHMLLHVFGIMSGDTSENHLANLICNGMMMAKLRKKYPYQVPGAPEQLNLDALLDNPAIVSIKLDGHELLSKAKLNLASLESQLERIEKSTREFPQTFQKPEEVNVADIIGQCVICHLDVVLGMSVFRSGITPFIHLGRCYGEYMKRENTNAQA